MCCYVPCIEPGPLHIYKLIWYISEREARTEAGRLVLVISSFLTDWRKFLIYSRHHLSFGDYMWLQISSPILWAVLLLMLKLYVVSIFLCSSLIDFLSKFPFLTTVASRFLVISSYLLPLHLAQTSFGTLQISCSVCPTLCNPVNRGTPGLPVPHQLPEFTQTHVHRVSDAIQPSHFPAWLYT